MNIRLCTIVTLCLLGTLFAPIYAGTLPVDSLPFEERKALMEELLDNNLGFSDKLHFHDVIRQEPEMSAYYLRKRDYRRLTQLKELVIYILATQGEIIKASKLCMRLTELAQELDYGPGKILANFAKGDVFLNANMLNEALNSYRESLQQLKEYPDDMRLQELILLQYVPVCLHLNLMDEAEEGLRRMEQLYTIHPEMNGMLLYCYRTYYYNLLGDYANARLNLRRAEESFDHHPTPYYCIFLFYAQTGYAQATGDYESAVNTYRKLVDTYHREGIQKGIINYNRILAKHYTLAGKYDAACQAYNEINAASDSINKQNYTTQINLLRTVYEVDAQQIENQRRRNRLLFAGITGSLILLGLTVTFILFYRHINIKLKVSRALLEEARRNAERSIRTKSLFLSNMSHEIRTPLNALSGFSSILVEEGVDEETRRQCSEIINQNSDLLQKLIADVVDFSNIDLDQMKFHMDSYEVVGICRSVVDTVERIKQTAASVSFDSTLESLALYTDKARLQQVLINLLINATKFTTEGSIVLSLQMADERTALFCVTDTGCGIPSEKRDRIFQRFEKLDENAQGSGLGLSICQLIIEHVGGKIWIDPDYSGGSRFCFTHPLSPVTGRKEETT